MAAVLSCTPKFVLIALTAAVKLHFKPIILPARHRMVEDDRDLTGLVTDVPLPAAVTARSSLEPPLLDIVLLGYCSKVQSLLAQIFDPLRYHFDYWARV